MLWQIVYRDINITNGKIKRAFDDNNMNEHKEPDSWHFRLKIVFTSSRLHFHSWVGLFVQIDIESYSHRMFVPRFINIFLKKKKTCVSLCALWDGDNSEMYIDATERIASNNFIVAFERITYNRLKAAIPWDSLIRDSFFSRVRWHLMVPAYSSFLKPLVYVKNPFDPLFQHSHAPRTSAEFRL